MATIAERIAELALNTFDALPRRCKPRALANGTKEWTPLSATVLSRTNADPLDAELKIVSLATGTKSLPVSALPKCHGLILHDCHAEILALRGFNHWLLCEIEHILDGSTNCSTWLQLNDHSPRSSLNAPPFCLRPGVEIHLFSTEAPCGDASMELLMASAQAAGADTHPWSTPTDTNGYSPSSNDAHLPPGRGYFSKLGALRRKPARADAEISMSKSCTDKIMLKQFTSLLQFPVSLLVKPTREAFLNSLIVYEDQYDEIGYTRAFSCDGRLQMSDSAAICGVGDGPRFFKTERLPANCRRFEFEKQRVSGVKSKVSNISAIWLDSGCEEGKEQVEVLVNGVRQGFKQFDDKQGKGSVLCRYNLVRRAIAICDRLHDKGYEMPPSSCMEGMMYLKLKNQFRPGQVVTIKNFVLDRLGGWPTKIVEDDFDIESDHGTGSM